MHRDSASGRLTAAHCALDSTALENGTNSNPFPAPVRTTAAKKLLQLVQEKRIIRLPRVDATSLKIE